jgi:hypothetical protein
MAESLAAALCAFSAPALDLDQPQDNVAVALAGAGVGPRGGRAFALSVDTA